MKWMVLLLLTQTLVFSQPGKKEALFTSLRDAKSDAEKTALYFRLSKAYKETQVDSAIHFAKKAYESARRGGNEKLAAESAGILGDYFIEKNRFDDARRYYTLYTRYVKESGDISDYCETTMIIANIEMVQNNYTKALRLYYECLDIAKEHNLVKIIPHLYNNLGNLYFEIEEYKDAKAFFVTAYEKFNERKDAYNAALALSNISNIHIRLGEKDAAIKGYLKALKIFSSHGNWEDIVMAYHALAEIYLAQKQYAKAREYVDGAIKVIGENERRRNDYRGPISLYKAKVYQTAAVLSFNRNEPDKAIGYAHKSLKLSYANSYKKNIFENAQLLSKIYDKKNRIDSALYYHKAYVRYNDEYNAEYDLKKIIQLKMQYQFDDILRAKAIEEVKKQAENKRTKLIYLGISIFTALGIIIMVLLYRNQKVKTAKVILTKEKLDQDIEYKKKELASQMIYVLEKNEFIASIAKKLLALKPGLGKENQSELQRIINELNQNSSSKIWDEFEIRFKEVHAAFYDNLNALYPDLTPNEIKICAFLRLNMSTKEISAITHQTVKSINMARFRLRKKLNIETEENLISYLIHL